MDILYILKLILISMFFAFFCLLALGTLVGCYLRLQKRQKLTSYKSKIGQPDCKVIGFFHPNCDAGAGGEKVLWSAVAAL